VFNAFLEIFIDINANAEQLMKDKIAKDAINLDPILLKLKLIPLKLILILLMFLIFLSLLIKISPSFQLFYTYKFNPIFAL